MANPTKSRWTRAAPTRLLLMQSTPDVTCRSWCARSNILTTSSNRTTRHQAGDQADAQLQIISLCPLRARRHRAHAHDSQRRVHDRWRRYDGVRRPLLYAGRTSPSSLRSTVPFLKNSVFWRTTRQNREQRIDETILVGIDQLSQIGTEWLRWQGAMMRQTSIVYNY